MNYILDELIKNKDLISFHVPGHKNGKIFEKLGYNLSDIYKLDSTEIIGTDNLHKSQGIIKNSMDRASRVFKSDKSYFLVNGTTCGIHASIMSVCNPQDKLIVNRDCHQSIINTSILLEIDLIYSQVNINSDLSTVVDVENLVELIKNNKDAKGVLITYPTYYGQTFDLEKICEITHENNMIVIVDEAHGAHLGLSYNLPKTALSQGADIVIQSTHKTLPSFTQSSMLHIQGNRVNKEKIESFLRVFQSSSPSYLFMTSLEIAVDIYEKYGTELMKNLLLNIEEFKDKFIKNNKINIQNNYDKTKVFIRVDELCGYDLEQILREKYNIQVELSNLLGVLLITSIGNTKEDFEKLELALLEIENLYKSSNIDDNILDNIRKSLIKIPEKKFLLKESFYKNKKSVKINDSVGKICGEFIIPYPPGISLISPGEIITKEIIEIINFYKENNLSVVGIKNLDYIDIIDDTF